jgi:hypothetical protein
MHVVVNAKEYNKDYRDSGVLTQLKREYVQKEK